MLTIKQLREMIEDCPDNAEVKIVFSCDNIKDDSMDIGNVYELKDFTDKKSFIILEGE